MSGIVCAAVNCTNYQLKSGKFFFRFPRDVQRYFLHDLIVSNACRCVRQGAQMLVTDAMVLSDLSVLVCIGHFDGPSR